MSKYTYQVLVPVNIFREESQFVAYCPVLDLSTSGKTFEEAQGRFQEALDLFIEDLIEQDTLDDVLASYGWHKVEQPKPHWVPPQLVRSIEQETSISLGA